MPRMMDTVLNLGMNDETVEGLAKLTNNPHFAYDSTVGCFEQFLEEVREEKGYDSDPEKIGKE